LIQSEGPVQFLFLPIILYPYSISKTF